MTSADNTQVGGEHYKGAAIQHWNMAAAAELGYFEGQITKYLSRFRKKNGVEDIDKALHFAIKLCELAETGRRRQANHGAPSHVSDWCASNEFDLTLSSVLVGAVLWRTSDDLRSLIDDIRGIRTAYEAEKC